MAYVTVKPHFQIVPVSGFVTRLVQVRIAFGS